MGGLEVSAGIATVLVDPSGRLASCSPELLDLLGMAWPTIEGVHLAEIVHPDDHAVTVDAIAYHMEIRGRGDWTEARVRSSQGWLAIEFLPDLADAAAGEAFSVAIRRSERSQTEATMLQAAIEGVVSHLARLGDAPTGQVINDVLATVATFSSRPGCTIRLIRDDNVVVEAQYLDRMTKHEPVELGQVSRLISMLDAVGFVGVETASLGDDWAREQQFLSDEGVRIMFAAPIRRRGEVVGWLETASHDDMTQLTPSIRDAVCATADHLARTIAGWAPEASDRALGVVRATRASGTVSQALVIEKMNRRMAGPTVDTIAVLRIGLDGFGAATARIDTSNSLEVAHRVLRAIEFVLDDGDFSVALASGGFVVLSTVESAEAAIALAETIQDEIAETFSDSLGLSASVGLALNHPGQSARAILSTAAEALRTAKRSGRGRLSIGLP